MRLEQFTGIILCLKKNNNVCICILKFELLNCFQAEIKTIYYVWL